MIWLLTVSLFAGIPASAMRQAADPRMAAACVMSAWNAHDFDAQMKCYADGAVIVRQGVVIPFDLVAERGYRDFEQITNARFRYEIVDTTDRSVEIVFREESDFLSAIGVAFVQARWRYVVDGGRIVESHHLNRPDPAFASALREFAAWVRGKRPDEWPRIAPGGTQIEFNKSTAPQLLRLAREWQREKPDSARRQRF